MTLQAFRKLALSFEGAVELPHFERASFRIGKKIFATLKPDGSEAMVRLTAERALELIAKQPANFFSYGYWTERNGALGIHLERASQKLLEPLVAEAWKSLAAKPKSDAAPRRTRVPSARRKTKRG